MDINSQQIDISIVIPVYGCVDCLEELHNKLVIVLNSLVSHSEIILVEDASPDDAWQRILQLTKNHSAVKGIRLSRNFGQHKAITAGLDFATGEWIVVMDCDLQDKPEEITKLYKKAIEGYDIVFARRSVRKDSWLKKNTSKLYHRVFDYLTGLKSDEAIANFGIYSKKVINQVLRFNEKNRSFPLFVRWVGFSYTSIDVDHSERLSGKSSYSISRLFSLAFDTIIAHSNMPLKISVGVGAIMSFSSFGYSIYLVLRYLVNDSPVAGWTSVMVSIYFLSGLILLTLGILGIYIGKIFDETKNRPLYIVQEITWEERDKHTGA